MPEKQKSKDVFLQTPKGTRDILPEKYFFYEEFFKKAEDIAKYYGFLPVQTPHLEKIELFTATVGETTDIIEKQMYTLRTRGGDRLVLRPEGTAPAVRVYLKYGMHTWPQPVMLYYRGAFFRHENPQFGRLREFQQFGLEILGEKSSIADATIIKVANVILEEAGLKNITVRINSIGDKECRNPYRKDLLNYYRRKINHLCRDCQRRLKQNPLRLLDCKEKSCLELKQSAPQMINYLCPECKQHFKEVLEILDNLNISYLLDNYLVRGLDYYSRTVFEIFSDSPPAEEKDEKKENAAAPNEAEKEKIENLALASGGRYDYLAKMLTGKELPGVGMAMGVDRIILALDEKKILRQHRKIPKVFFIQIGAAAKNKSLSIIEMFRKANIPLAQSLSKDSLKSQLKIAQKLEAAYILILGQKEALEDTIIARNATLGSQETIPFSKVIDYIKERLKK